MHCAVFYNGPELNFPSKQPGKKTETQIDLNFGQDFKHNVTH